MMANEVELFGGKVDLVESEQLMRALNETKDEGARGGDISYMSFSGKSGEYKIGVDKREPEEDEPFLVAIPAFELGYMCWKGGKPISKRMANISAPKIMQPDPDEYGPFDTKRGEGWALARAITVRSMVNEEQCYFANNSKSGVASISDLQAAVVDRMSHQQPCWPVVVFGKEKFESQGFTNYKPTFEVIAWMASDDVSKLADADVDPMSLLDEVINSGTKKQVEDKKEREETKPRRRRL